MEIVFLQNSATQPRCHKRYRSFVAERIRCSVYSFHRNWYNVNLPKDIEIHSLGEITKGHHFKRLFYYIRKLRPVFKCHSKAVFYCYGLDMAFVALLFHRKYVYEESDLEYLPFKSFIKRFIQRLDLYVQKHSIATVLTSQGFVEYLYENKPENVFVLPNKLPSSYKSVKRPSPISTINMDKLRFAFVGLLRYKNTITPFIEEMMKYNSNYEFIFWGDGGESEKTYVNDLCVRYENVSYHGPFRNPDDLPSIYSKFDIVFACYDNQGENERIAEPNKLYESMFFLKPIMVSPGTYVSRVVEKIGNGFVVDCYAKTSIRQFLESLSQQVLIEKVKLISSISESNILDCDKDIKTLVSYINDKLQ